MLSASTSLAKQALVSVSCLTVLVAGLGLAPADGGERQLTVVELFTSQGCSSCPPADALLAELIERPELMPLSWSVDYWDYLGWQDSLARPEHGERQRDYSRVMGLPGVYTPQMIIDGRVQMIGSKRDQVLAAIEERQNQQDNHVLLTIGQADEELILSLSQTDLAAPAALWLVGFDPEADVQIDSGENHGQSLVYHNVVRSHEKLAHWRGEAMTMYLPLPLLAERDGDHFVILIQEGETGPILAAARLAQAADPDRPAVAAPEDQPSTAPSPSP